jgi:hypothetical protein
MLHPLGKKVVTVIGAVGLSLGLTLGVAGPARAAATVTQNGGSCEMSAHWHVWFSYDWTNTAGNGAFLDYAVARSDGALNLTDSRVSYSYTTGIGGGSATFQYSGLNAAGQFIYRADPNVYAVNAVSSPVTITGVHCIGPVRQAP